jgi:hypothetical protein
MSELESVKEVEIDDPSKQEEERAKKTVEEIKAANELYAQKLKALNDKKTEVQVLQNETLEALQRATALNEQFNMIVNRQLLSERDQLKEEVKKLKTHLEKKLKVSN